MSLQIEKTIVPEDDFLTKGMRIEQYLRKYRMRYNIVKGCLEWVDKTGYWVRMTDRTINSLSRELRDVSYIEDYDKKGNPIHKTLERPPNMLLKDLESDYLHEIDPIKEYLQSLKPSITGAIAQFANVFTVASWYSDYELSYVETYWKKWLVGAVANSLNDDNCKNHLCLVLVGSQGLKKGFLIEELVPIHMRQYIKTDGNFDPRNKDSVISIAQYFILHLDDMLKRLNTRDYNEIKNAITRPDIKVRKSYGKLEEVLPHRASFIATVNDKQFITDLTGARRFFPLELAAIDWEAFKQIDIDKLWSEARYLYENGYKYWVNPNEERQLESYKEQFTVTMTEQGLIEHYFEPYNENKHSLSQRELMTTTMVLEKLHEYSSVTKISDKKLAQMLLKLGFQQRRYRLDGRKNPVSCYAMVTLRHGELEDNLREWE